MSNPEFPTEKVHALLKEFGTVMLITHDSAGTLHARPMAVAEVTPACALWFITGADSPKTQEIARDTSAHVVCQKEHAVYLSLAGRASLVQDSERVKELWQESFKVWFPDGPTDPNIALIAFEPERVEYWDQQGVNKLAYLWEAARAYVTGTTPAIKEGEQHGVVAL